MSDNHQERLPTDHEMIADTWLRTKRQSETLRQQNEVLNRLQIGMYGRDPNMPGDGLMSRVKSLEASRAQQRKIFWWTVSGAATAVGGALVTAWSKLTGNPP